MINVISITRPLKKSHSHNPSVMERERPLPFYDSEMLYGFEKLFAHPLTYFITSSHLSFLQNTLYQT